MKYLIVLASVVLTCSAAPQLVYSTWPVVQAFPAATQYHAQDALGQYSYGYSGGPSAKSEVKTLDGVTRGSYSYIDANSQLQTVQYVSDALGFRVAATNLPTAPVDTNVAPVNNAEAPKQVEDTVEVKQARAEHLAAVAKARSEASEPEELEGPEPVEDTEEVKQARADHLQAHEDAKARLQELPKAPAAPAAVVLANHHPQLIQTIHPAALHLTHAPLLVRSNPGFAYSVVSPGGLTQVISA